MMFELTYMNRPNDWPPGPWDDEPDKVLDRFPGCGCLKDRPCGDLMAENEKLGTSLTEARLARDKLAQCCDRAGERVRVATEALRRVEQQLRPLGGWLDHLRDLNGYDLHDIEPNIVMAQHEAAEALARLEAE